MRVRLRLADSAPLIWRTLDIDPSTPLDVMHLVLQRLFDWQNVHLHQWRTLDPCSRAHDGVDLAWLPANLLDEMDGLPDTDETIGDALALADGTLHYEYDFGDSWHVAIERLDDESDDIKRSNDARPMPAVDGARRGPLDDVGGIHAWNEAVAIPQRSRMPVDPAQFDPAAATASVRRLLDVTTELPALRPLLTRVNSEVGQKWLERAAAVAEHPPIATDAAIEASIAPVRWMLRRIGPEGTALTAAGWLPPALVREAMRELGWEHRDVGKMNREDLTPDISDLRARMRWLGLLRVAKGRIALTAVARRLVGDPGGLWRHVAENLVSRQTSDVSRDLMLLLALHLVTGRTLDERQLAAQLALDLTALGWRDPGRGVPGDQLEGTVSTGSVRYMLYEVLPALHDLGAFAEGRKRWEWSGELTSTGRALGWQMLGRMLPA